MTLLAGSLLRSLVIDWNKNLGHLFQGWLDWQHWYPIKHLMNIWVCQSWIKFLMPLNSFCGGYSTSSCKSNEAFFCGRLELKRFLQLQNVKCLLPSLEPQSHFSFSSAGKNLGQVLMLDRSEKEFENLVWLFISGKLSSQILVHPLHCLLLKTRDYFGRREFGKHLHDDTWRGEASVRVFSAAPN